MIWVRTLLQVRGELFEMRLVQSQSEVQLSLRLGPVQSTILGHGARRGSVKERMWAKLWDARCRRCQR